MNGWPHLAPILTNCNVLAPAGPHTRRHASRGSQSMSCARPARHDVMSSLRRRGWSKIREITAMKAAFGFSATG